MEINLDKIDFDKNEEVRERSIYFTYTENKKKYDGTLVIMTTPVGGMDIETYEVTWADKTPKSYDAKKDDEKIYELYRDYCAN